MPYETPPWTQIIAHRGNSGPIPENTVAAIESAIALGVDMIEVDIRLTRDGVPILMHSAHVDDPPSGAGLVADLPSDELRKLDAGSWRGPEFANERVSTLNEILDVTHERVALNLDIKVPEAARPTAQAVIEAGASARVVISGCTSNGVRTVAEMTSAIAVLFNLDKLLSGIDPSTAPAVTRHSIDLAVELGAVGINVPHPLVDADLVAHAAQAGVGVWAFTIDDESRFVDLIDAGVASLTTNWPERMLPLVKRRISRPGLNFP